MKTKAAEFKKAITRVGQTFDRGKVDEALLQLEEMLAIWPDHPRLLVVKGRLIQLSEYGSLPHAKRAFKRAIMIDKSAPEPWIELGHYLLAIEDRADEAEEKFDQAIALSIGLLLDAIKGKVGAIEDQTLNGLSARRHAELADLLRLVQSVAKDRGDVVAAKAADVQQEIAFMEDVNGARKSARNGRNGA